MLVCWSWASARDSAADVGGDLEGHRPVGQVPLAGQVDPAERPAAQLASSRNPARCAPTSGKSDLGLGEALREFLDRFELVRPGGGVDAEVADVFVAADRLGRVAAEAVFLERDGCKSQRVGEQLRVFFAVIGEPSRAAVGPGVLHLDADQLGQGRDEARIVPRRQELADRHFLAGAGPTRRR